MLQTRNLVFAGALLTGFVPTGALAVDGTDFGERLQSIYASMGYDFTFETANQTGSQISLDGVILDRAELETSLSVTGPIVFEGVRADADGNFLADSATLPDFDFEKDETAVSIKNIAYQDVFLSGAAELGYLDYLQIAGRSSVGPVSVTIDDKLAFEIEEMSASNTFSYAPDGTVSAVSIKAEVPEMVFHLENLPARHDTPIRHKTPFHYDELADALFGSDTLTASFFQEMDWSLEDGRVIVSNLKVDASGLGSTNVRMDISGFTPAMIEQFLAFSEKMEDNQNLEPEARKKVAMAMGMGLLTQVSLNSISVRYVDDGFAEQVLDFKAEKQNLSRDAFVQTLTSELDVGLAMTQNSQLKDEIEAAVKTFLNDPQSLEISLTPPTPLPALAIFAMGASPATLVDSLGIKIVANQPAQ